MLRKMKILIAVLVAICLWTELHAESLPYVSDNGKTVSHINISPSEELYCMHFDRQGLLWLGTSEGIKVYDGYSLWEPLTNAVARCPQLGGDVRSLTTDKEGYLWAGTNDGLVRLNMESGTVRLYRFPKQSQKIIYTLFTASDGTVYVGTDDGFSIYNKEKNSFEHYNVDYTKALFPDGRTDRYTGWGVKDFVETAKGDILVGTWKQGLWCYSPRTRKIRAYAKLNWMNSAFTLCIDSKERLWIGTQACGIGRIDRADDYQLQTYKEIKEDTGMANFRHQKIVHDLAELADGRIYICAGDTVSAQRGPDGALWIATRGNGIVRVSDSKNIFRNYASGCIRSLYTDNGRQFYIGYGIEGLAWLDTETGEMRLNNRVPGYASLPSDGFSPRITSMVRRHNGELWMAAGDNGILVSRPDGSSTILYANSRQMPYVKDNVTALYESPRDHTLWIGQRQGVSVLTKEGKGRHLDIKTANLDLTGYFMVNHITEDHGGRIWISSAGGGIVRIDNWQFEDSQQNVLQCHQYTISAANVTACFEDSRHQIWAIGTAGLLKYHPEKDCFESACEQIQMMGNKVIAINEDRYGALWLATDQALVRMDDSEGGVISFTEEDGLSNTSFMSNATFSYDGQLFFGTTNGLVAFEPMPYYSPASGFKPELIVTDISIDGTSIQFLDSLYAAHISKQQPMRTQHITIPWTVRKWGVEFALLTYSHQELVQYAYRLERVDKEWQYIDGHTHRAVFEHIPSGNYRLHLRAADNYGQWYELPYTIQVRVLAPWYATWWAYIIYICVLAVLGWFLWHYYQMERELKASRRFSTILQSAQVKVEPLAATQVNASAEETMTSQPSAIQQKNAVFIARATQLVLDHLDESGYNRDSMASDLGMSVSSLYARMRECTDLSIHTFIQAVRLNAACDILRTNPDIRISELAYRVGFNTPKYFSQCFKKEYGMLPGDFIKQEGH